MKKYIYTAVAIIGLSFTASAQTQGGNRSANHNATIEMHQVLDLTLVDNGLTNFVFDNTDKYDNGITQPNATTLKVKASVPWNIHFKADASAFAVTAGTSNTEMPLSVFSLGINGGSLQTLTDVNSASPLSSGARGGHGVGGNTFGVDYQANPGYGYDPATYQVGITYTISAQ